MEALLISSHPCRRAFHSCAVTHTWFSLSAQENKMLIFFFLFGAKCAASKARRVKWIVLLCSLSFCFKCSNTTHYISTLCSFKWSHIILVWSHSLVFHCRTPLKYIVGIGNNECAFLLLLSSNPWKYRQRFNKQINTFPVTFVDDTG